mgnify:FL=1
MLKQFHAMAADSWHIVDASQPIDAIQQQLRQQAAAVVERCKQGGQPLRQLWNGRELQCNEQLNGSSTDGMTNGAV